MENNLPPFYVGQRVVAIVSGPNLKHGEEFIVLALDECPKCKCWSIDIGRKELGFTRCECGFTYSYSDCIDWYYATSFAPINEQFQSITFEKVREQESKLTSVN